MINHTLFISDLHLDQSQPQITQTFLNFLKTRASQADALYILGDFFEYWLGDNDRNEFNEQIITELKKFTDSGVPTYFMYGNRDFLIGKRFAKRTGVQFIKDPTTIDLYGKPVLLTHGDCLCTLDIKHQAFRKKYNNKLYRKLLLFLMPLYVRRWAAKHLRKKSIARNKNRTLEIMDVTPEEVERMVIKHNTQTLIHGHTHRPNIHNLEINNKTAQRIVLGSWHDMGSVLQFNQDGHFNLISLQHS